MIIKSLPANITQRTSPFVVAFLLILLSSCASVSVRKVARVMPDPKDLRPMEIFVAPFTFTDTKIKADRTGEELAKFKVQLQNKVAREIVRRLPKNVAPALVISQNKIPPQGPFWLITGNFDRVNQGSRFLRTFVGLGTGGTKMETSITVWDLSGPEKRPFLHFSTTGGSNITQGVGGAAAYFVSGPTALLSVIYAVDGMRSGVSFDATRTAREINATLSQYLYQRGLLPKVKVIKPKRLGSLPEGLEETRRRIVPLPASNASQRN